MVDAMERGDSFGGGQAFVEGTSDVFLFEEISRHARGAVEVIAGHRRARVALSVDVPRCVCPGPCGQCLEAVIAARKMLSLAASTCRAR